VLAPLALADFATPKSGRQLKRNAVRAIEIVARHLGNTPAVCRNCYIHPAIVEAYADGLIPRVLDEKRQRKRARQATLRPEEAAVLEVVEQSNSRNARSVVRKSVMGTRCHRTSRLATGARYADRVSRAGRG
jgi:DNA topoisomerase-1